MMIKKVLLYLFFFAAGFLVHALIFPDMLANGILFQSDAVFSNLGSTSKASNQTQPSTGHDTVVSFDGENFNRTNVSLAISDYITIRNESTTNQMLLISDNPELTTVRGYAYKEQVHVRLDKEGQYHVLEKNGSNARLTITVKK